MIFDSRLFRSVGEVWHLAKNMEEPMSSPRKRHLAELISKLLARGLIGQDMFYLEDKLTTTAGIKDICEENLILIKNMIDNDFAEACF